ncbi:MAG: CSLREA domain-containing protein, partial [Burkholderiales bacterium]|nr:CSLREA domain-containing protein [Phycisphaerae bacterium]
MTKIKYSALRILLLACIASVSAVQAATITVTSSADTVVPNNGTITLREAITAINAGNDLGDPDITAQVPGVFGVNDTINFNIAGGGIQTISPTLALPVITKTVTIDGFTQPGASVNNPQISLSGLVAGGVVDGLALSNHSGSAIRGLAINDFGGNGITISGTGGSHTIAGNFIGTLANGTTAAGNGGHGVFISGVPNNIVGGSTPAARNVISANGQAGVFAGVQIRDSGATGNTIAGNLIGVDKNGTVALGNSTTSGFGISIFNGANGTTIGGTTPGSGNVISANGAGIGVQSANNTVIQGNLIGLNITGTAQLGNKFGVLINGSSAGSVIGGATPASRNVISGHTGTMLTTGYGIALGGCGANGSIVQGNYIGTDMAGTSAIANAIGVQISVDHHDATIGGTTPGTGNLIAFNTGPGVLTKADNVCGNDSVNNAILGNSIHSNGALGIDLNDDGVTANDVGDADAGVNKLQNYPILTSAVSGGASTVIGGTLNSTAGTTFRVEFFSNAGCDASGFGEGRTLIGFATVTTDGAGNGVINSTVGTAVAAGEVVTATATDPTNNTSEFSACRTVTILPSVTINQAGAQVDPTNTSPINFTVMFSSPVTGFDASDVSLAGSTVGGTLVAVVTGGPTTYNVAVSGMNGNGTVVATIPAAAVVEGNSASTSTDNTVTFSNVTPTVTINQAGTQSDPTAGSPINFTVVFSAPVTGFTGSDISFTGSTVGGTLVALVTGGPTTYNVA